MGKFVKRGLMMIVTFVTIILIIFMGITIGGRARITTTENVIGKAITPIQRLFYAGGQIVDSSFSSLFKFRTISKENEELKKEVEKLNKQLIIQQLQENELQELRSLRNALNYAIESGQEKYITANVTGMDMGNWFNMFTINVGENHGVVKDSAVINGAGLVGKVYEVGDSWSKVISIIDNKSSVSFELLRNNNYIGVIRGSINSELSGYLIDPNAEVLVGDKIVTTGLSVYPKGILIGEVTDVVKAEDELLSNVTVDPVVNFKKLNQVFVIIPNKNN